MLFQNLIKVGDEYIAGDQSSVWIDLLINCAGAFVGFGLSLLIYWHQRKKEKIKEIGRENEAKAKEIRILSEEKAKELRIKNEERKDLLVYYSELIKKHVNVAERDLKLIAQYTQRQEKDFGNLEILSRVPSYDFTRLINIDNRGVFEAWRSAFSEQEDIKEYSLTNSAIDTVEGVIKEVHRIHQYVTESSYTKLLEVKNIVDAIPNRLSLIANEIVSQMGEVGRKDPYVLMINKYIVEYSKLVNESTTMTQYVDEYVTSLITTLYKDFPHHRYADEMMIMCKKARVLFNDVKIDTKKTVDDFKGVPKKLEESFDVLKKTQTKLEQFYNN